MISGLGPIVLAIAGAFLFLNTFSIGARLVVRKRISKNLDYNDAFIVIALLAYDSLFGLLVVAVINGVGGHTVKATIKNISDSLKYIWFLEFIYVILTSFMKVSIALTLLQWTKGRILKSLYWISIFLDFAISVAFMAYLLLQCQPISYAWELFDPTKKGKCLPFEGQLYMGYALSFVTVGLDMLFLVSPFFLLHKRDVNSRLKAYIYGIVFLGVVASIANFIRLAGLVKLKDSKDQLFDAAPVFAWSAVEVSIGLVVAGILELGPLFHKWGIKGFEYYGSFNNLSDIEAEPIKMMNIVHMTYDPR